MKEVNEKKDEPEKGPSKERDYIEKRVSRRADIMTVRYYRNSQAHLSSRLLFSSSINIE
jgi:hypothetical protein